MEEAARNREAADEIKVHISEEETEADWDTWRVPSEGHDWGGEAPPQQAPAVAAADAEALVTLRALYANNRQGPAAAQELELSDSELLELVGGPEALHKLTKRNVLKVPPCTTCMGEQDEAPHSMWLCRIRPPHRRGGAF